MISTRLTSRRTSSSASFFFFFGRAVLLLFKICSNFISSRSLRAEPESAATDKNSEICAHLLLEANRPRLELVQRLSVYASLTVCPHQHPGLPASSSSWMTFSFERSHLRTGLKILRLLHALNQRVTGDDESASLCNMFSSCASGEPL